MGGCEWTVIRYCPVLGFCCLEWEMVLWLCCNYIAVYSKPIHIHLIRTIPQNLTNASRRTPNPLNNKIPIKAHHFNTGIAPSMHTLDDSIRYIAINLFFQGLILIALIIIIVIKGTDISTIFYWLTIFTCYVVVHSLGGV